MSTDTPEDDHIVPGEQLLPEPIFEEPVRCVLCDSELEEEAHVDIHAGGIRDLCESCCPRCPGGDAR